MSERSLSLTAVPASAGPDDPDGAELLDSLAPLLAEWMPRQRWFAGKGRPISGFSLEAATELLPCSAGGTAPGLLHLLVRTRQPVHPVRPPDVTREDAARASVAGPETGTGTGTGTGADGGSAAGAGADSGETAERRTRDEVAERGGEAPADCYQLLLGVRRVLPPELVPALIGHPASGPLGGLAVYEALHDPRLAGLLLERLRSPGRLGPLRFVREPEAAIPTGLRPCPLTGEQSNSSVVYGSAYILKVFRRVERGVNPDLELPLALARGGSVRVPAPTAWFEATVPVATTDGTRSAGGEGKGGAEPVDPADSVDTPAAPLTLGVLQPFLSGCRDGWQLALDALAERRDFTGPAFALGRATAEVHTGLAAALPVTVLDRHDLERTAAGMAERLETASATVPALRPFRGELRNAFHALADLGRRGRTCRAQRVHGDLHLGQVLREESGHWSLIDFEGEPARPLAERRSPQPVVRDIAGILRSFDYAACQQSPGPADPWSREWSDANRAAFCAGYAEVSGSDPREERSLLRAYETDKAVYEVVYEARHRPAWLGIPMSAIRRLAAPPVR